jgi:uncharacterized protein (DUF2062 family)
MLRKTLKKTSKSAKLKEFIKKYKVPKEYLSTSRKMISRAVFLGLFIAFIPMPFQMLLVLAFMPLFKFNVPIALAMCWLSNPFTMPFMYYMEYKTGIFLLGMPSIEVHMTLQWFSDNIDKIFIPLYTGTAFYSVFGSAFAYFLVNYFWRSSVQKDKAVHFKKRKN